MKTIYKYPLEIADVQWVTLPAHAELLCIQLQHDTPTLWALVEPSSGNMCIQIHCYGTGNGNPTASEKYLGTVQQREFVWHYFEDALQRKIV